ncbi:MAG: hypothetical protein HPY55_00150 [Firmicutes bacterium]|nr:hypothetical protein [Bacillota bacterium]
MTRFERVMMAIRREREPDRVPWGELGIEAGAARNLLSEMKGGKPDRLSIELEMEAIDALGMDIAPVNAGAPGFEDRVRRYRLETDAFVLCVVGGGFYECMSGMGFDRFMLGLRLDRPAIQEGIAAAIARNTSAALEAVDSGAHGILIGDDIAYSGGTYLSPRDLRVLLFPRLGEMVTAIKHAGCVPFFHSDGDLNAVFEDLVSLGFEVIHSLEPSAGMDLRSLKRAYGERVCLMGNVEVERLAVSPAGEVEDAVREAISAGAPGGGFILSSSSGVVRTALPIAHILAFRKALVEYGRYHVRPAG